MSLNLALPPISIPEFNGEYLDWPPFNEHSKKPGNLHKELGSNYRVLSAAETISVYVSRSRRLNQLTNRSPVAGKRFSLLRTAIRHVGNIGRSTQNIGITR